MSEPIIRQFTVPLNRCTLTAEMKKNLVYPPELEFEQLKKVRHTIEHRLMRQEKLISKIERGKFRMTLGDLPVTAVLALAKGDLKSLRESYEYFEARRSELRRKIHEKQINMRSDPEDSEDNSGNNSVD